MSRKFAALQRRVARLAAEWQDPHDELPWSKKDIVQNIEIKEDGEVTITVKPTLTLPMLPIRSRCFSDKIVVSLH